MFGSIQKEGYHPGSRGHPPRSGAVPNEGGIPGHDGHPLSGSILNERWHPGSFPRHLVLSKMRGGILDLCPLYGPIHNEGGILDQVAIPLD